MGLIILDQVDQLHGELLILEAKVESREQELEKDVSKSLVQGVGLATWLEHDREELHVQDEALDSRQDDGEIARRDAVSEK